MKTLIFRRAGCALTMQKLAREAGRRPSEKSLSIKKNQALVCVDGKITWMGPDWRLPKDVRGAEEVDLEGRTILPAFVECHTHLVFAGARSDEFELRNTGVSYQEIARRGGGILSTVKATRRAREEELVQLAQKRVERFIEQGVTLIEVKSGYALRLKEELKMLKVARRLRKAEIVTSFLGAHAVPPEFDCAADYIERLVDRDLGEVSASGLADRADVFIEKGFFTRTEGKRYLECARSCGLGLTIHADQLSRTGATALGASLGAQSVDHVVEASAADIRALAASETTAVLLPAADYYLKMKYPPARKLIDAGARVALATDFNPGSSPTQDLATVGLMARLQMQMTLPETIAAYTWNAASALGRADTHGSLERGKACDFAVLEGDWSELFYSIGRMPVIATWRAGRCLWRARAARPRRAG